MNLQEKISKLKNGANSNCHGTALYLIGAIGQECSISISSSKTSDFIGFDISSLKKLYKPNIGDLVTFRSDSLDLYVHSAVVVELEPEIIIFHREKEGGNIGTEKLEKLASAYFFTKIEYYTKRK